MTAVCALSLTGGIALAARLTCAEIHARRDTAPELIRATELDRFAASASYFERLADLDPEREAHWLGEALRANPRDSAARIALGLAEEHDGSIESAERDLLQTASFDRQYLPAWTLANFYFRNGRRAEFWLWARRAAALTYDDFRPLLALAHTMEPDARTAVENLGTSGKLLDADLDYLAEKNRLADAQKIARLLMARRNAGDKPRLLALAELQIRAGRAREALELWNAAAAPIDPQGEVLGGGNLANAPTGIAFDWRLPENDGVASRWQPGELAFSLSGAHPELCVLLERTVAFETARRYRLRFEYRSSGLSAPTGLAWDLDGDSAVIVSSDNWRLAAADFRRPQREDDMPVLIPLRLIYRRELGTVRAPGQIQIRNLSFRPL